MRAHQQDLLIAHTEKALCTNDMDSKPQRKDPYIVSMAWQINIAIFSFGQYAELQDGRERERERIRSASIGVQGPVLIGHITGSQVEHGCSAEADSLLVLLPHKILHGTVSICIEQLAELATNGGNQVQSAHDYKAALMSQSDSKNTSFSNIISC